MKESRDLPGPVVERPEERLTQAAESIARNDYDTAIRECQYVLTRSGNIPPADEALFNMVVIYSHPVNKKRDLQKSFGYLKKLTNSFPQSRWTMQGEVWMDFVRELERQKQVSGDALLELERQKRMSAEAAQELVRLKRVSGEAFQEIDRLKKASAEINAENQKLKKIVEQSRLVDLEIDQKKRDQAK
jgi:hypothetical protein